MGADMMSARVLANSKEEVYIPSSVESITFPPCTISCTPLPPFTSTLQFVIPAIGSVPIIKTLTFFSNLLSIHFQSHFNNPCYTVVCQKRKFSQVHFSRKS